MVKVHRAQPEGLVRLRELCNSLEESERVMKDFFDLSPDLLAVVSVDGSFQQANPSWQKILGWGEETLDGISLLRLLHPDDQPAMGDAVKHLAYQDLSRMVCRIRARDGHYQPVEFSATKWINGISNFIGRLVPDDCLNCPKASPRLTRRAHGCDNCGEQRRT